MWIHIKKKERKVQWRTPLQRHYEQEVFLTFYGLHHTRIFKTNFESPVYE